MVQAVEELHRLGFVHRRLTPECFWVTEDEDQPFILSNLEYTTATTNQQPNFNISDSIYSIRGKNWVAGDRRADLNSLALILLAFDVGLDIYKKNSKSNTSRKKYVVE